MKELWHKTWKKTSKNSVGEVCSKNGLWTANKMMCGTI